jgi:hypothetical protein
MSLVLDSGVLSRLSSPKSTQSAPVLARIRQLQAVKSTIAVDARCRTVSLELGA